MTDLLDAALGERTPRDASRRLEGVDAAEPARLESVSPATGAVLGSVLVTAPKEVARAVEGAANAQRAVALAADRRSRALHAARRPGGHRRGRRADRPALPRAGPPARRGRGHGAVPAIETLQWLAERAPKILSGERIRFARALHPVKRGRWSYEPLGVVGVLGPAAEPFATPLGDVAVALMAGNGVVFKPSPYACLAGERIARVFARAGLPDGLLRVVHGHADTGSALVNARVAQVRFTGTADAGRAVGEALARRRSARARDGGQGRGHHLRGRGSGARGARRGVGGIRQRGAVRRQRRAGDRGEGGARRVPRRRLRGREAAHRRRPVGPQDGGRADRGAERAPTACASSSPRRSRAARGCSAAARARPVRRTGGARAASRDDMRIAREDVPGPVLTVSEATPRTRRSRAPTRSRWASARRSGPPIATRRSASPPSCASGWCGSTTTCHAGGPGGPVGRRARRRDGRARGAIALRTCAEPKVVTWDPPRGRAWWWFPYDAGLSRRGARSHGCVRHATPTAKRA